MYGEKQLQYVTVPTSEREIFLIRQNLKPVITSHSAPPMEHLADGRVCAALRNLGDLRQILDEYGAAQYGGGLESCGPQ